MHRDAPSISNAIGLQGLLDEPARLAGEAERLNVELESLVMDNYKVFVENLTCSVHLKSEDKKLSDISHDLEGNLRDLSQQCISFKDRVSHFVSSHKRNRKTLQHHMQLVELLEVPQLVDACARNGFHDEALELANFVNGLERRHLLASEVKSTSGRTRGGSGVIQSIVDDVHRTLAGLRQQLLSQLAENTTLPKEISILATLRKLDGLLIDRHIAQGRVDGEAQHSSSTQNLSNAQQAQLTRDQVRSDLLQTFEVRLQMDFLEARTAWLRTSAERSLSTAQRADAAKTGEGGGTTSALSATDKARMGPYGKVSELLEVRRTAWFAVITQFKALFQETHGHNVGLGGGNGRAGNSQGGRKDGSNGVDLPEFSAAAVLSAWATRQVHLLLCELQQLLPQIEEGASLRSVLEQTLFFASRMSQVGCDFSGLALPLFQEVMCDRFAREVAKAAETFKSMVLTERVTFDGEHGDGVGKEQMIPLYSVQDAPATAHGTAPKPVAAQGGELAAPELLMHFPPLAYLLNSLLTHMNYLRECPLVTTEQPALAAVLRLFQDICAHLIEKRAEVRKLGDKYLSNPLRADKTKRDAAKSQDGESGGMDRLYARAIALELLPHVLICFETVYSPGGARLESKLRAVRARDVRRHTGGNAAPGVGGSASHGVNTLNCLVSNLYDARDLFEGSCIAQLEQVWSGLVRGGLLSEEVLTAAAPAPPVVPTVSIAAPVPVVSAPVTAAADEADDAAASEAVSASVAEGSEEEAPTTSDSPPARKLAPSRDTSKDD